MELSKVELERCREDLTYDGFFDYVEVGRIANHRFVHRENHQWLGIVDEFDNVLLPLIYDKLIPKEYGVETVIETSCGIFHGLYGTDIDRIIFPAIYDIISPALNYFWCYDKSKWKLISVECKTILSLSHDALPLDHNKYICILKKNRNHFNIEVFDDNFNHSQLRLRNIAYESKIPNRIMMTSKYCNLDIFSDIYGNVIYSNIDIDYILSL